MRILFVGMHNKPGKQALDSSTMTGKVIDQIISQFPGHESLKVNLCETEYQPPEWMMDAFVTRWKQKYNPSIDDVVVLLGKWVQKHLKISGTHIVLLPHPAGVFGKKDEYIAGCSGKIKVEL